MKKHKVIQGEDIDSLAFEYGFHPDTLWEYSGNNQLREKRDNPNVLKKDDIVVIPDLKPFNSTAQTGARHTFLRKGVPAALRIQFCEDREPSSGVPYILKIKTHCNTIMPDVTSETDNDGFLVEAIPPNTTQGEIILDPGENEEIIPFQLGQIDPIDEGFRGIQAMLNNLGYFCGEEDDEIGEMTKDAIKAFQEDNNLEIMNDDSTEISQETLIALQKEYFGE